MAVICAPTAGIAMSLFDGKTEQTAPTHPPCALCGAPAWWQLWGEFLCEPHLWACDATLPHCGEMDAQVGPKGDSTAEFTKRTRRWIAAQRYGQPQPKEQRP